MRCSILYRDFIYMYIILIIVITMYESIDAFSKNNTINHIIIIITIYNLYYIINSNIYITFKLRCNN